MWRSLRPKRQLGWVLIRRRAFQVRQNLRDDLRLLDAGNQCKTEDEVSAASEGCSALLVQFALVGAKVFAARPGIGLASRIGAGYDTIDAKAAQAGVGLDVLPTEPVPAGHPLLADPRVIFSPHSAFYSVASEAELRTKELLDAGTITQEEYEFIVAKTRQRR